MTGPLALMTAIMDIAAADTAPSVGVVALTGKADPVRRTKAAMESDPPVVGIIMLGGERGSGVPDTWRPRVRLDIFVPLGVGSDALEETLADRLQKFVMTTPLLGAKGIDATAHEVTRLDTTDLLAGDGFRLTCEYEVRLVA